MLLLVATLRTSTLGRVARIFIILYAPFAVALSLYYLCKKETWQVSPNDGSVPDTTRYRMATRRSSAIYAVLNILLLVGAKIFGISYSSVNYNYISLFATSMITYVYDRCVSTDDGLDHLKKDPARTIFDAYLSYCSPSFMRYMIVLACEIPLMILIAYYIGSLIPSQCWVASTLFRKSIVPVVVFAIVGGPLRFAWAYPTVTESGRVPYLLAYSITFTILAVITYASGRFNPAASAGILILMSVIAVLLQIGGLSNAPKEPDVYDDARVMPIWLMLFFSTVVLVSTLGIAYKVFVDYLHPYIIIGQRNSPKRISLK